MKKTMVSLRFTLGYALLRLQRVHAAVFAITRWLTEKV